MENENKCRTCLTIDQNLNSSFTEEFINNNTVMYSDMIFLCTNVQVSS